MRLSRVGPGVIFAGFGVVLVIVGATQSAPRAEAPVKPWADYERYLGVWTGDVTWKIAERDCAYFEKRVIRYELARASEDGRKVIGQMRYTIKRTVTDQDNRTPKDAENCNWRVSGSSSEQGRIINKSGTLAVSQRSDGTIESVFTPTSCSEGVLGSNPMSCGSTSLAVEPPKPIELLSDSTLQYPSMHMIALTRQQ
jgi:hypothetical protein